MGEASDDGRANLDYDFGLDTFLAQDASPGNASSSRGEQPSELLRTNLATYTSTTFRPDAGIYHLRPNIVLQSVDVVHFHVHTAIIRSASSNHFDSLFVSPLDEHEKPSGQTISVAQPAEQLDILLRSIYHLPFDLENPPPFETVSSAVNLFPKYGLDLQTHAVFPHPLHALLITYASQRAMPLYCLAAAHDLLEVATAASAHLLSYPLAQISEEMSERIGGRYLRKLMFLHLGRADALKRLLLIPPQPHAPSAQCDSTKQKEVERVWALACAYLAWEARADTTPQQIWGTFTPLSNQLPCYLCKIAWNDRVTSLVNQWGTVKSTVI